MRAGEGRVHTCLRMNKDKISPRCLRQEMKLQAVEYRDIRLRPKLNKLCSEEKAVYCKVRGRGESRGMHGRGGERWRGGGKCGWALSRLWLEAGIFSLSLPLLSSSYRSLDRMSSLTLTCSLPFFLFASLLRLFPPGDQVPHGEHGPASHPPSPSLPSPAPLTFSPPSRFHVIILDRMSSRDVPA